MFDTYAIFEGERFDKTHMLIDELKKNLIRNGEMIDMLEKSLMTTDKLLLRVMWHNLREHMLSQCHYNSMCILLLKKQGYDVSLLSDEDHNKDRVKEVLNLIYVDEYLNIHTIDGNEVEKLRYNETSKEDRTKVDKYYFEHMTISDLPVEMKSKLFFEYYQVSHKKHYLANIKHEKSEVSDSDLIDNDFVKSDMLVHKMLMVGKKRQYIRRFNTILGLMNSCDNNVVVDKGLITGKALAFMKNNIDELARIYRSKIKLTGDKRNDNFCALKLLQKIYHDWSGLVFKKHDVNNKGDAKSYITNCFDFYECINAYNAPKDAYDMMKEDE
ncbi:hypothetical protein EON78_04440 [bacterium]|nr:MAG: hypothetical protein EON78_04440 [bacterium]